MSAIYFSSTYEDLTEYRRAVFDVLRQAGNAVIAMKEYVATIRGLLTKAPRTPSGKISPTQ